MRVILVVTALLVATCSSGGPEQQPPVRGSALPGGPQQSSAPKTTGQACPVTVPNGLTPPGEAPDTRPLEDGGYLGNGRLLTVLWPRGLVLVPPDDVGRDGSLGMKFPWWRGPRVHAGLRIIGHELTVGLAVRADIPDGYGDTGFQATGIAFPVAGCYEITGEADGTTLTFVTIVRPCSALAELPPSQRKLYSTCDA